MLGEGKYPAGSIQYHLAGCFANNEPQFQY